MRHILRKLPNFILLALIVGQVEATNLSHSQVSQETVKPKWKAFKLDGLTFSAPVHSSIQKRPFIEKPEHSYFLVIKTTINNQTLTIHVHLLSKSSMALQKQTTRQMYTLTTKSVLRSKNLVSSDSISLPKQQMSGIATKEEGKVVDEPYVFWMMCAYSQKAYLHATWRRPQNTEQYYHEVMRILNSMQFTSKH